MPAPGTPKIFQPALPMRGVTSRGEPRPLHVIISTRTPHAGSDGRTIDDVRAVVEFQPALPMRGVTTTRPRRARAYLFQPALPMRGVTRRGRCCGSCRHISTRTPHAGSDDAPFSRCDDCFISTRTPHARSDVSSRLYLALAALFQPALPMRGVTLLATSLEKRQYFNPHSPCGE